MEIVREEVGFEIIIYKKNNKVYTKVNKDKKKNFYIESLQIEKTHIIFYFVLSIVKFYWLFGQKCKCIFD